MNQLHKKSFILCKILFIILVYIYIYVRENGRENVCKYMKKRFYFKKTAKNFCKWHVAFEL